VEVKGKGAQLWAAGHPGEAGILKFRSGRNRAVDAALHPGDDPHRRLLEGSIPTRNPSPAQEPPAKPCGTRSGNGRRVCGHLKNGRYEIDNNLTENALRPACLGKRTGCSGNAPTPAGRSALLYFLIVRCRRRAIAPSEYLRDLSIGLPTLTKEDIDSALPANPKPLPK